MKIQIDVDGVLADFMGGASKLAKSIDPTIEMVDTHTTKDWDHWEGWDKKLVDEVWRQIKTLPFFFYDLKSLVSRETWMNLRRLSAPQNEIYFTTSRPGATAKWQTETWIYDRLEHAPTVIITKDKAGFAKLVKPDFSIEDNAVNAAKIGQVIGESRSFIVSRLYNQNLHPRSAVRVNDFKEFLEKIHV